MESTHHYAVSSIVLVPPSSSTLYAPIPLAGVRPLLWETLFHVTLLNGRVAPWCKIFMERSFAQLHCVYTRAHHCAALWASWTGLHPHRLPYLFMIRFNICINILTLQHCYRQQCCNVLRCWRIAQQYTRTNCCSSVATVVMRTRHNLRYAYAAYFVKWTYARMCVQWTQCPAVVRADESILIESAGSS